MNLYIIESNLFGGEEMSTKNIPVLILNEVTLFPSVDIRIDFENAEIKNILNLSERYFQGEIVLAYKENPLEESRSKEDLLPVGVLAQIALKMELPNRKLRVTLHGLKRTKITAIYEEEGITHAKTKSLLSEEIDTKEEIAYIRMLKSMILEYIKNIPYNDNILTDQIREMNDLDTLTDTISFAFNFPNIRKQEYLMENNPLARARMLIQDIRQDFEIVELERQIDEEVGKRLDKNQKDFVLREKIKAIKEELGDNYDQDLEILKYRKELEEKNLPDAVREKITKEISRLESMSNYSPEVTMTRTYIEWLLSLPWNEETEDEENLAKIEMTLNKTHHGIEEVKTRILEYIAVKQNTNHLESPILCLVGPPGVGKTTLAKSIAEALNRKCSKISVGGIQDEADIVGHRRTYIGSQPGLIIQGMKKAGTVNPVFIIDEIDKMTKGVHGDPASSLLEVLDKEQNDKFVDHYLEEEYDLSKVMFIATANYIGQIPLELLDRLEVIELSSYTEYEKLEILKKHIIPKAYQTYCVKKQEIEFTDEGLLYMIRNYTKEAGVREAERFILKILRKKIKNKMSKKTQKKEIIRKEEIIHYLGKEIYEYEKEEEFAQIGVVNGLSYTPFGGDTLRIEATMFKGSGNLTLTGSLGEVMQESALLSLSYIKANASKFGIKSEVFQKNDIHIHAEEGAIKKDGPSAGVSLTTVLLSVLKGVQIPANIAMTGEMTLRGKVLPIGGVKEKVIGAHKERIQKIYLPRYNERNLEEVPTEVKREIDFVLVDTYQDIYQDLFQVKRNSKQLEGELIQLEL